MAPLPAVAILKKSPPRTLVRPALPNLATVGFTLPKSARTVSSPLHEAALAEQLHDMAVDDNGGVKLSTTPEGTPHRSGSPKKHMAPETRIAEAMTPPDTKYATSGPLVVDGSMHRESLADENEQSKSSVQVVKSEQPKDPFLTTPIRHAQLFVNPTAIPVPHITACIQANLAKAHALGAVMEPPREDRLVQPINAHNAQGLFPKQAKLFVANLSNLRTDDQLEISVNRVFAQFGDCVVIIKRDRNHQPMGFVQYYSIEAANQAMETLNGTMIDARVIRLEFASARQELIISMLTNGPLAVEDVRQALVGRGPIASITPTGPSAAGSGVIAWLVEFRYYADCKEAIRLMRDNSTFRVVPAPKIQREPGYPIAPPRTPQGTLYQNNDSNSVFAGGLPDSVTESELSEAFDMFGTILSCNIISKPMTTGGMNTFAFIEFKYAEDAASAADSERYVHGQKIRVERKQYAKRRAARVGHAAGHVPVPLPTPQIPQYLATPCSNGGNMAYPPYRAPQNYRGGPQPFSFQDYHTTPPTPVYMVNPFPYTTPAPTGARMRGHPAQRELTPYYHGPHHGLSAYQDPASFSPTPVNYGATNVIAEKSQGNIFN